MATVQEINDQISLAQAYYIQLLDEDTARLVEGNRPKNINKLRCIKRLCKELKWDLDIDVNDDTTTAIYELLLNNIYLYNGEGITVDPNVYLPGRTVITVPVVQNINSGIIPFSTSGGSPAFVLAYGSGYQNLYGPNPDIDVYIYQTNPANPGGPRLEVFDDQTPHTILRSGAFTSSPISTISMDFITATDGYIKISGTGPASSGGGGGGGGGGSSAIPLNFNQGDLLPDTPEGWYLPLSLPVGMKPVYIEINGVQTLGLLLDDTVIPNRLTGFANNDTQTILVRIV